MDKINWKKYNTRAKIIKALAHPSRLFIVEELKRGERQQAFRNDRRRCFNRFEASLGS